MKVMVGIKALNEEQKIAAAIDSALAAVRPIGGYVIIADSGSQDRTIEIAKSYPVQIVQLAHAAERSCGAGAQLAFQHVNCEYFYLLDGDMVLASGFLSSGIKFLDENQDFAGVGGQAKEMNTEAHEFRIQAAELAGRRWRPGIVDRLDGGGLYRVSAIRQVGYFADRNLHAFEEFELAARLRSNGWKLARIDEPSVEHFGHTENGYTLMWRRFRSGYTGASGEVLRGALGKKHFRHVVRNLSHIRTSVIVVGWWLGLVLSVFLAPNIPASILLLGFLIVIPCTLLVHRRRSLVLGLFSFVSWNLNAIGLITGLFRSRVSPETPLDSINLQNRVS